LVSGDEKLLENQEEGKTNNSDLENGGKKLLGTTWLARHYFTDPIKPPCGLSIS